jgi:branched-chain amino acid transport system substrate-binding protein
VNFILLDDATDPTAAVKNVRKLISEDKVDAILGPNLISTAVAMADVANGEKVPMISVAPSTSPATSAASCSAANPPPT